MSDRKDVRKDESRKRKLMTSGDSPSANQTENVSSTENPPTAEEDAASEEDPTRESVGCSRAKQKRKLEKYVRTVITQSNHQRDLETQRELAVLQAQNDDSDNELQPRRMRSDDCPTIIRNVPRTESAAIHLLDYTNSENNVDSPDGTSSSNSSGENNDDSHQTNIRIASAVSGTNLSNEELTVHQRYQSRRMRDSEGTALSTFTTPSREISYIPLPGTSNGTVNTLNSIDITDFVDHDLFQDPEIDINVSAVPGPQSFEQVSDLETIAPSIMDSQSENAHTTNCESDNTYYQVRLVPEGEQSDVSDEMLSIFGDDYDNNPPQSVDRFHISSDIESTDDEEFLQMVDDVNNISVSSQGGYSRSLSSLSSRNQVLNPGGLNQHREGGQVQREFDPQPHQIKDFAIPYQLPAEDPFAVETNRYYVLNNDHVYYPVVISGQKYDDLRPEPTNHTNTGQRYSDMRSAPTNNTTPLIHHDWKNNPRNPSLARSSPREPFPPLSSRRRIVGDLRPEPTNHTIPLIQHDWKNNPRNPSLTRYSPREPFPRTRRTGGWSRACRLTSRSSQNVLSDSQNNPNRGAPEERPTTSSQAVALSDTRSTPFRNEIGICPICKKGLCKTKVVSTFCGHLFCTDCIKKIITTNGKQCPKCSQPLQGQCYHPIYF